MSDGQTGIEGRLVGDRLGIIEGVIVAFCSTGVQEGATDGKLLGLAVFGALLGLDDGIKDGTHVGSGVVGNVVGVAELGYV